MTSDSYMLCLRAVADADIQHLEHKEKTYAGSWKKRGGSGAWLGGVARKIDRLETMLPEHDYDIFGAISALPGGEDGSALAEVRDMRRYLLLIEAEMVAQGVVACPPAEPRMTIRKVERKPIEITEDGSHQAPVEQRHAYTPQDVVDGVREKPQFPSLEFGSKEGYYYIANRDVIPDGFWEHLPKLPLAIYRSKFQKLHSWYEPLYNKSDPEVCTLIEKYRKRWSRKY